MNAPHERMRIRQEQAKIEKADKSLTEYQLRGRWYDNEAKKQGK